MRTKWKLTDGDVNKMLNLYQSGLSKSEIARKFNVDHSTVFYHIVKNTDKMMTIRTIGFRKPIQYRASLSCMKVDYDGQRINLGRNYREYIAEQNHRRLMAQKECKHTEPFNYHCRNCGKQISYPVKFTCA